MYCTKMSTLTVDRTFKVERADKTDYHMLLVDYVINIPNDCYIYTCYMTQTLIIYDVSPGVKQCLPTADFIVDMHCFQAEYSVYYLHCHYIVPGPHTHFPTTGHTSLLHCLVDVWQ